MRSRKIIKPGPIAITDRWVLSDAVCRGGNDSWLVPWLCQREEVRKRRNELAVSARLESKATNAVRIMVVGKSDGNTLSLIHI